jgi:hypothetical protein
MAELASIPEDRSLTPEEEALVRWLLEHGNSAAAEYLSQISHARVASRCPCGCASIDFAVHGRLPPLPAGTKILADYVWQDAAGRWFGVIVFARGGVLAGLEVWSVDGSAVASTLPDVGALRPFSAARAL